MQQQQVQTVINEFANAINHVNFAFDDQPPPTPVETCEQGDRLNPLQGVECLPIGVSQNLTSTAQLFDICKQLDLAVQFLAGQNPSQADLIDALEEIEDAILDEINANTPQGQVVAGIINCLIESWLPVAFSDNAYPSQNMHDSPITAQSTEGLMNLLLN